MEVKLEAVPAPALDPLLPRQLRGKAPPTIILILPFIHRFTNKDCEAQ